MKKILSVLLFSFFICGCSVISDADNQIKIQEECEEKYKITLDEVFTILETTDKETLETYFGSNGEENEKRYSYYSEYARFDENNFSFNYSYEFQTHDYEFILKDYENNESVCTEIKEQFESKYDFEMKELRGMYYGDYIRLYYAEKGCSFYWVSYMYSDGEELYGFGKEVFESEDRMKLMLWELYDMEETFNSRK